VLLDRGRGSPGWTYTSTLKLADLLPLAKGGQLCRSLSLVNCYPIAIEVYHESGKQEETSFDVYVFVLMPIWKAKTWEGCLSRSAGFEYRLRAGSCKLGWFESSGLLFDDELGWGYNMFPKESWEEIVHENSAYFPGGQMLLEVGTRALEEEDSESEDDDEEQDEEKEEENKKEKKTKKKKDKRKKNKGGRNGRKGRR